MGRYVLMGYKVQGADENTEVGSTELQQKTHPPSVPVQETDSAEEAAAIVQAGGFFGDRDSFTVVTRAIDRTKEEVPESDVVWPDSNPTYAPDSGALDKRDYS